MEACANQSVAKPFWTAFPRAILAAHADLSQIDYLAEASSCLGRLPRHGQLSNRKLVFFAKPRNLRLHDPVVGAIDLRRIRGNETREAKATDIIDAGPH